MAFNVQEFRAQMVDDGARNNLFKVTLTFPAIATIGTIDTGPATAQGASQKYTFMARTASLPGSVINPIPVMYFGREVKFAGNRTFPEWTVTILNDEDFIVRKAFEKWMSGINTHAGNLRAPSFLSGDGGYQQDGRVIQYGKTGDIIKIYNFVGMFPINLSPIDVSWDANDSIEEYAVTFAYQWWESDTTDTSSTTINPINNI